MSRERLTSRTAEDLKAKAGTQVSDKGTGIDNDTAAINNPEHTKNDPKVDQYAKGDPSAWGEDVNKDNPAKDDKKREDTGHAPLIDKHAAEEAVASAKRLEEKAVKCIIAAQRILPGAAEEMIEKQAAILMHLPEEGLNATLSNQEELAKQISSQAVKTAKDAEDADEKDEDKKKEATAAPEKKDDADEKDEDKKKEAAKSLDDKKKQLEELKKKASEMTQEIEAAEDQNKKSMKNWPTSNKKANDDEDKDDKPSSCAKDEDKKEDKSAAADKKVVEEDDKKDEDKKEAGVEFEASDATILDQIFGEVTASETKKGAAKISGMVKKEASEQVNDLSRLWSSAPDVSNLF